MRSSTSFRPAKRLGYMFGGLVMLLLAAFLHRVRAQAAPSGNNYLVLIGTYTSSGTPAKDTGSKGIYAYRFNSTTGELASLGVVAESTQPSFVAVDPAGKFLFAANETDSYQGQPSGSVSSFSIDRSNGKLTFINEIASRGASPAHIAVDRTGKYALVSNYNGGNLAVFSIGADGKLGTATAFVQHHGSSVNKDRQAAPHVHETILSPDNRFALSTDLGLDQVFIYPFDAKTGTLGEQPRVLSVGPGSGPRHMSFAPDGNFVYLVSEMASTVSALPFDPSNGNITVRQVVRLAPAGDPPANKWAGEIEVGRNGKYVYASNRGDNFIGIFSTNASTGELTRSETVPLEGKTPRNFEIDPGGQWLWDANQDSNNIVLYKIDPQNGNLQPSGLSLKIPAPTCVVFVPVS
jgi:6-phosphogluconolactonase